MQIHKICRKLKQKYKFKYDINAIFSDLIYARILDPCSKLSSYKVASEFLEKPSYEQQKIKKRKKEWALSTKRFKTVSDDTPVDITKLSEDDKGLYYKDEPYTTKKLQQRLIITYCLKYALYQKSIHRNRDSFHCINEKRSLMFFMKSVVFEQIINSYYSP